MKLLPVWKLLATMTCRNRQTCFPKDIRLPIQFVFFNKEKFIKHFVSSCEFISEIVVTIDPAHFIGDKKTYRKSFIFKLR